MQIDPKSWHARVYQSWFKRKYECEATKGNLCSYCRVVLFWSWIRPLFIDGYIGRVPMAVLSWSSIALFLQYEAFKHFGWFFLKREGLVVLIITIAIAFVLVTACINTLAQKLMRRPPVQSFWSVLGQRVKSAHEGICPFITFKD
jgi:hypothetical protein